MVKIDAKRVAAILLAASASVPAWAGVFTVSPVRIFMTPRDRAVAVTVTNDGDEELVMQAEVFSWAQKPTGEDELTPSDDLVLSPPILKLAPKARQVVRLAMVNRVATDRQVTYRLVVREVPEVKQGAGVQMQVALAFSMPVFITPPGAKRDVACSAARMRPDTIKVTCANGGSAYGQVRELAVLLPGGERFVPRDTGGYLLSGITRSFEIRKPEGAFAPGKHKVEITLDDGTAQSLDVTVPE